MPSASSTCRAILRLLDDDEWKRWSDREIATRCGVDHDRWRIETQADIWGNSPDGRASFRISRRQDLRGEHRAHRKRAGGASIHRLICDQYCAERRIGIFCRSGKLATWGAPLAPPIFAASPAHRGRAPPPATTLSPSVAYEDRAAPDRALGSNRHVHRRCDSHPTHEKCR